MANEASWCFQVWYGITYNCHICGLLGCFFFEKTSNSDFGTWQRCCFPHSSCLKAIWFEITQRGLVVVYKEQ